MSAKILLILSVSFNAALLGVLTYVCNQIPERKILSAHRALVAKADSAGDVRTAQPDAFAPRPGAVIEALLPDPKPGERPELFDFETGRRMTEPVFDHHDARTNIAWIRKNGLDISGVVSQSGKPICIGYYMAVVPVDNQLWETATPADIQTHPELDRILDPKRPFIVPAHSNTETFLFRTAEGTTGILHVLGVTEDRRCVKIHYKLLSPVQPMVAYHAAAPSAVVGTQGDSSRP